MMLNSLLLTFAAGVGASISTDAGQARVGEDATRERLRPSHESARDNANLIFNALHSAGRQWGSSLHHNGFSFFPASMPEGTLLYHGSQSSDPPPGPEWLAFEIEHAEGFGRSQRMRRRRRPPVDVDDTKQHHLYSQEDDDDDMVNWRGYLHTYQTRRHLQLLYVDGMSAGKTSMGTLDSQDLILRENKTQHDAPWDEWGRALDLCDLLPEWGYDGIMRMEIGFEVILCNFSTGVDRTSLVRTFLQEDKAGYGDSQVFDWSRAVSERYNGIGGGRVKIDYSSMVSGLFFPINISSPEAGRPDLRRLGAASLDELKDIKEYLKDVATGSRRYTVNWQDVVDMIVSRFAKRLASLASPDLQQNYFIDGLEVATLTWVDAPPLPDDVTFNRHANGTSEAVERCRKHYLLPALTSRKRWSLEDELIHTAVDGVMNNICHELLAIRTSLLEASDGANADGYRISRDGTDNLSDAVVTGRSRVQRLMEELGWTTWKQKQPCLENETLFIAMWPFGDEEDHWNPGCRSIDQIRQTTGSYWGLNWGRPKPPSSGDDGLESSEL